MNVRNRETFPCTTSGARGALMESIAKGGTTAQPLASGRLYSRQEDTTVIRSRARMVFRQSQHGPGAIHTTKEGELMINEPYLESAISNKEMADNTRRWNNIQRINMATRLLEVAAQCLESKCESEGIGAMQLAQSVLNRVE